MSLTLEIRRRQQELSTWSHSLFVKTRRMCTRRDRRIPDTRHGKRFGNQMPIVSYALARATEHNRVTTLGHIILMIDSSQLVFETKHDSSGLVLDGD